MLLICGYAACLVTQLRIADAASMLGVSDDTVRRWLDAGRLAEGPRSGGRRTVDAESLASAMAEQQATTAPPIPQSARNRFPGIVTRVERDAVMALVEIQAGPHRVTSLMSRESADDLGLAPGVRATAVVKSTNVVVSLEQS